MIRRKGFRNFIRSQEDKEIFVVKDCGFPKEVFRKAPANWKEEAHWILDSFVWSDTPQGSDYWVYIYKNGWTEESEDIIRTWISQGYL